MHFSRNKNITYQVNPSTGQNGKIPTINIPKPKNENSIFIQNLIEKSERFKTFGSNYKVLTKCCPKLSTNIQNIFSSDKGQTQTQPIKKRPQIDLSLVNQSETNTLFMESLGGTSKNNNTNTTNMFNLSPVSAFTPSKPNDR